MQAGVLDDISKQMGLWAQLRHIAGELRAIRGGGAARKASALRAMLRCPPRLLALLSTALGCHEHDSSLLVQTAVLLRCIEALSQVAILKQAFMRLL